MLVFTISPLLELQLPNVTVSNLKYKDMYLTDLKFL